MKKKKIIEIDYNKFKKKRKNNEKFDYFFIKKNNNELKCINKLSKIFVPLSIKLQSINFNLKDLLNFTVKSNFFFKKNIFKKINIVLDNSVIAHGKLIFKDGYYGIQILNLIKNN